MFAYHSSSSWKPPASFSIVIGLLSFYLPLPPLQILSHFIETITGVPAFRSNIILLSRIAIFMKIQTLIKSLKRKKNEDNNTGKENKARLYLNLELLKFWNINLL